MKTKIKKVYYCEFCNKHSLTSALRVHEEHCTANPNRKCKLCGNVSIYTIIQRYKGFYANNEKITIKDVYADIENECPNCILTVIRCSGYTKSSDISYDYKEQLKVWWEEVNTETEVSCTGGEY